jgi:hypothetical protein
MEFNVRSAISSKMFSGASGFVIMIPPLPTEDIEDSPYTLIADSLAHTLLPQTILNGDAFSKAEGILHWVLETIEDPLPLQLVSCSL